MRPLLSWPRLKLVPKREILVRLSPANRELVDRRLTDLQSERKKLATELERVDAQMLAAGEMSHLIDEMDEFIAGLDGVLRGGDRHEK